MICKQTPDAPKKKTGTNDPKKKKDIKTSSNKTETESSETPETTEERLKKMKPLQTSPISKVMNPLRQRYFYCLGQGRHWLLPI